MALDAAGTVTGFAQYGAWPARPAAAELALAVADAHQARGVGMAMGAQLVQHAARNGLDCLTATTQITNRPCRSLLGRLGFVPCGTDDGLLELELDLRVEVPATVCDRPAAPHVAVEPAAWRRWAMRLAA